MFIQDCVWVTQRWIISPKTTSLSKDLSVQARPAQKEELKIQAKNTCLVELVKIFEKLFKFTILLDIYVKKKGFN